MPELKDVFEGEPEAPDDPGYTEEMTTVGEVLPEDYQELVNPKVLKIPIVKRDYQISESEGSVSLRFGQGYELILQSKQDPPEGVPDSNWSIATEYSYVVKDGQVKGGQVYTYMADGETIIMGDF